LWWIPLQWLPDVFQQYAETLVIEENPEQRVWIEKLNDFKERNKDRFIFLYFGTAQKRRGYDMLLKMAVENKACFIHCGLTDSKEKYDYDVTELKSKLQDEGRLMETNQYISDPLCIEHFFKSVNHLVLPYRNFLGSSGVMLQALYYRIPVLVPEKGIMGYRVKKHNLGLTYNGDDDSLIEQFKKFKDTPKDSYTNGIDLYMQYQSKVRLKEILIKELTV
jgi:glycosyltransferase involved in cell wall biosynthesis